MKPMDVLTKARDLILDPANWVQGMHASSPTDLYAEPWDPSATCFCADGAIARAAGVADWNETDGTGYEEAAQLLSDSAKSLTGLQWISHAGLNDGDALVEGLTPHQATIKMFDLAIEKAKETQP